MSVIFQSFPNDIPMEEIEIRIGESYDWDINRPVNSSDAINRFLEKRRRYMSGTTTESKNP